MGTNRRTRSHFRADNIDQAVDKLAEARAKFERCEGIEQDERGIARDGYGPPIAWFKDPAGNRLSVLKLRSKPVGRSAATGSDSRADA